MLHPYVTFCKTFLLYNFPLIVYVAVPLKLYSPNKNDYGTSCNVMQNSIAKLTDAYFFSNAIHYKTSATIYA